MYNRSFGQNTELTSKYAETVIKASKTDDVSYVLKHFPGYSNNSDTHTGTSVDSRTLDEIKEKHACVSDHRGMGLMQGIELKADVPAGEVSKKALERGLILITAGSNVLRFLPPLIIGQEHVDEMYDILNDILSEL